MSDWKLHFETAMAEVKSLRVKVAMQTEAIEKYREVLKLIADGTICPDLFPNETNHDVLFAKTSRVAAVAILEALS